MPLYKTLWLPPIAFRKKKNPEILSWCSGPYKILFCSLDRSILQTAPGPLHWLLLCLYHSLNPQVFCFSSFSSQLSLLFVVVQWLGHVQLFVTPWPAAHQASLSFTISRTLFKELSLSWVDDAIQPSHPLSSPSPPDLNLSQHQCLFQWVGPSPSDGQSIRASESVRPMNIQGCFPLGLTGLISLLSRGVSRAFSSTTVQKHQFFSTQPSLWSNSHIHIWLLWLYEPLSAKWCLCFLIHCLGLS